MWIKIEGDSYVNTDNGAQLGVSAYASGGYRVWTSVVGVSGTQSVRGGYLTVEDAQEALDSLMGEQGYEVLTLD